MLDTLTRKTIATLPMLSISRQHIEIDFQDNTPIWAATSRSGIGYVNPLPPTFTARITSPALGSTVSGTNVTVSTSVIDNASITGVDLYKDGVLFSSTTSSPYTFTWDTTKDANGSHQLMVTANDTLGNKTSFVATFTVNSPTGTKSLSLNAAATLLAVTTTSLPAAGQNIPYSATLAGTGGTLPYTWSISGGSLPAGLTLAPSSGVISGTPTRTGNNKFTVRVTDATSATASKSLGLTVTTAPAVITSSLPSGQQNVSYGSTLTVTGGTLPYTWSIINGSLPTGLTLASNTGVISGVPISIGANNFTVQLTDANSLTASKALSITINGSIFTGGIGLIQANAAQASV